MQIEHKRILKALSLELRHLLEGHYDSGGRWHPGDLEQRLAAMGVWRKRKPLPADELAHLPEADRDARRVADAYLELRHQAGISREEAVAEFVRETAYTWTNRLLALRCIEARGLIDDMVMVYVPAGEFDMGSSEGDSDAADEEFPQHTVTLDAFWIDRTEVSNEQFAAFRDGSTCCDTGELFVDCTEYVQRSFLHKGPGRWSKQANLSAEQRF